MKLKRKHFDLANHFYRFIDKYRFPDFQLSRESITAMIKLESYGERNLTPKELEIVQPLVNGKQMSELTKKMLFEEMGEWWSNNWGWYYPIARTIQAEFEDRHKKKDRIFIKALIKIFRSIQDNSFPVTLARFTGLNQEVKNRYLQRYLDANT